MKARNIKAETSSQNIILLSIYSFLSLAFVLVPSQANTQTVDDEMGNVIARQVDAYCHEQSSNRNEIESCSIRTYNETIEAMSCQDGECYWEVGSSVCVMNFAGTLECHTKGDIDLDIIN